ncbi:hypothetical protein [Shewanella aestuarii]|uniref:Uncharacterized protein n=1 Tax=Shewanella aestuarii TaxID=1028752 RepID=A0A6G9QQC8_9GAMM|nr:hypothetical protein [Shewanella aestuarii]QIR16672.1 hypothetical protein HBH39_19555 [Shewanella aestuarii]
MNQPLPTFSPQKKRHKLISRMVAMAGAHDWQADKSILVLRNILNLRSRIRSRFLAAISAVTQCLAYNAQLTPTTTSEGSRVLFAIPDYLYVSNIASQCGVSRYTVYRVLDYLEAIGDLVTTTKFDPVTKEYSPMQIILTESFYIRIGFTFEQLKDAIKSVNKQQGDDQQEKKELTKNIKNGFKQMRPSVKRRLTKSTERILSNNTSETENKAKFEKNVTSNSNAIKTFAGNMTINRGQSANDYAPASNNGPTTAPAQQYLDDPQYKEMIIQLKEAGVPISQLHNKALEALKNSK